VLLGSAQRLPADHCDTIHGGKVDLRDRIFTEDGVGRDPAGCGIKRDLLCRYQGRKFPDKEGLYITERLYAEVSFYHRITSLSLPCSIYSHPAGIWTNPSLF
jgi:hypothetical protein